MTMEAEVVGAPSPLRCWSTEDVPPRDALAYWRDSIGQVMLELDIEADGRRGFSAHLDQGSLGPVTANFLKATPQCVSRTRSGISRSSDEAFLLVHLRQGEFQFVRAGQTTQVRPGDCLLMDSRERYGVVCPLPTECLILHLPASWLRARLACPETLVGRVLHPAAGWAGALTAAVAALDPADIGHLALSPSAVAEQIVALLALASGPVGMPRSHQEQLHGRLRQALQDRYHEIGLTPAAIAGELGISVRYLHHLFAKQATTFGRELLRVRVERARTLLDEHRGADQPIGEVAARCGFAEASHFARCFRSRFGVAPSDYRRRSLTHGEPSD